MIDKFKTCKNCPDRTISPNCHNTCEGYLHRVKKQEEIKAKRKQDKNYDGYMYDKAEAIRQRFNRYQKNKKKYR